MGRSATNSNIVSGESVSGSTSYIGNNYSSVPCQLQNVHYGQSHVHSSSGGGSGVHQLPSPPLNPHRSQYLNQLANAAHYYEGSNNNGSGSNNATPPARVYSPLSHGSSNSTGSSVLSYVSGSGESGGGGGNNNNGTLTIMDPVNGVKYEFEDFPQEPDGGPVKIGTWKEHVAVFNIDQVGVMCDVLLQEGDLSRLVDLLSTVAKEFMGRSEKILRAQAHVAFHAALEDARKFPHVYKILETNSFSLQYHGGLQKLWFNAHYKEAEITRGRPLGAVDKYRIRRKFPLPRTIWDGEETVYCFKERSRNSLRESFKLEKYPNLEEKKKLSKETGLTMTQVGNWFKNKRQREKEKEQGKAAAKRPKTSYNSPVGLGAMTPDILGMMLGTGGGAGMNHLPPHHHHHHHHSHPSLQQHIAPLSPEDLENAIRKARFVDEAHRLKSYIDDGIYSNSASNLAQYHHSNNGNGIPTTANNGESPSSGHNGGSFSPRQVVIPGKSDTTIGVVGSPGGANGQHPQHPHHHHHLQHQQHHSPKSNNGVPSPASNNGHIHPQQHSPPDNNGMDMEGSPGSAGGGGGDMYGNSRPRSNTSSSVGVRCGADLISYHAGGHHHHHHPAYHSHHHHLLQGHHQGSPNPAGYDGGAVPLIHTNAAVALSHA